VKRPKFVMQTLAFPPGKGPDFQKVVEQIRREQEILIRRGVISGLPLVSQEAARRLVDRQDKEVL
jgi:hypothetical protein